MKAARIQFRQMQKQIKKLFQHCKQILNQQILKEILYQMLIPIILEPISKMIILVIFK
jgi:hypothetical protein